MENVIWLVVVATTAIRWIDFWFLNVLTSLETKEITCTEITAMVKIRGQKYSNYHSNFLVMELEIAFLEFNILQII